MFFRIYHLILSPTQIMQNKLSFYDFSIDFESNLKETWLFQSQENSILKSYSKALKRKNLTFLPIQYFKSHVVKSGSFEAEQVFTSSGTTGDQTSQHFVKKIDIYTESFIQGFHHFYGPHENYCFLCLLPSYLERKGSSLIYMADYFIKNSEYPQSDFFLDDFQALKTILLENEKAGIPTILLGVTYALLDFAAYTNLKLEHTIVMETGGMKGKRKEMMREEVHEILCKAFNLKVIHSEYGMTELLSQAYSKGNGIFQCPPWMQIKIRDTNDPFSYLPHGKTGGINIIDLANQSSCAFIETQDLGKLHADGSFEVLGRFDHSDVRGCNLLIGS
jgi:phenylacetate-coenzyme A ligase PaaK-like adenylate-forming protein